MTCVVTDISGDCDAVNIEKDVKGRAELKTKVRVSLTMLMSAARLLQTICDTLAVD